MAYNRQTFKSIEHALPVGDAFIETDTKTEELPAASPNVSVSRKRPRGSGVGKSIHKAAEAPVDSTSRSTFVISKSQVAHRGQPVTPRISASNIIINVFHDDVKLSPSRSTGHARQGKNVARKTTQRRGNEAESSNIKKVHLVRDESRRLSFPDEKGGRHPTSSSSSRSDSLQRSFSPENYVIPDSIAEKPPAPLVEAYEKLLASCLSLQHSRRLPFLLRNLKKAFRISCRKAGEIWPLDHISLSCGEERETILVSYRYTDPRGVQYAFQSPHFVRECPLCSLMGIFPNWSTLARHMLWNHAEIKFEVVQFVDDMRPKVIIYLAEDKRSDRNFEADMQDLSREQPKELENKSPQSSPTRSPTHPSDPEVEMEVEGTAMEKIDLQPNMLFQAFITPTYHGPAEPVVLTGPNKTASYRPTGPRLYDHLASFSLDEFGPLSWFVLDKEEETFELTDVLDEDKVMCTLWGRWIILNRSAFISDYKSGAAKFLDQYWSVIHKAAGWAAWRAWLLTLVYREFLTNKEMVDLLKRYNELTKSSATEQFKTS